MSLDPLHKSVARKLVIVGDSAIAEVAYEFFTNDSPYDVVAFTVSEAYRKSENLLDRPVVPFEKVDGEYSAEDHAMFVAIGYGKLNRVRTEFVARAEAKGYDLASYVSSRAFVWHNVEIGPNAFILEHNVIQPFVRIGKNVTLWSGNHIGHHSTIRDNTFIASHVVVSGFVEIGESCFLGVNATLANNITLGRDCLIGAGALILRDTEPGGIYGERETLRREGTTLSRFGIE